jgi:hypothetical protein
MPQLAKGGKWVFGWCVVGPAGEIHIPPHAFTEYGFQAGETVITVRGSQRSGGFGIGRSDVLARSQISLRSRFSRQARIGNGMRVVLPPEAGVQPGERLLAVRGSGLALGFLQRGLIYEEALKHPEVEIFDL